MDKQFIFNIDIQDYFGAIHFGRVRNLFIARPFGFENNIATILAQICCFQNALPQGAPTSPIVANLISFKLDGQLQKLAKRTNSTYTRYADDISFSFTRNKARLPTDIVILQNDMPSPGAAITRIIEENGFRINYDKVRLRGKLNKMEVTRLTVNEFPNVPRKYIKQISSMLHAWEKFGYKAAELEYREKYDFSHRASDTPKSFKYVVKGKLSFLRSVRSGRDPIFIKLARRFNELVEPALQFSIFEESEVERDVAASLWVIETNYDTKEGVKAVQGTGFDLENFGVVTCAHVVSDKDGIFKEIKAFKPSNPMTARNLRVVYIDNHRDLAICDLFDDLGNKIPLFPLRSSVDEAKQRDEVTILGFPQYAVGKNQHYIASAKIASLFVRSAVHLFEIDHPIRKGNSGGPVINAQGEVMGIAVEGASGSSGHNAVVSVSEVTGMFNDDYRFDESKENGLPADVDDSPQSEAT